MKPLACLLILWATMTFALQGNEYRVFTNAAGKTIEARVLSLENGQVTIKLRSGQEFTVPVQSLSQEDQTFLSQWTAPSHASPIAAGKISAEAINQAIGHELFTTTSLWESAPSATAERLKWRRESKTEISESYRAYPRDDYRFLGTRPYSIALYGENEKITSVSIVFANKGDSFSAAGSAEEHFIQGKPVPGGIEGVRMIMENDVEVISSVLTKLLGESERQKFGEGESRVDVNRWDWAGHSFLLSHVEDEYVSLAIETTAFADARGRVARVSDATIRERARSFVERRDNGDVVITNIPMVDQGPKGYCVPATAERCMRFLGLNADMYLLAMVGETSAGGGTSVDRLLSNIGRDIKRKGRSFEIETGELKMRDIERSIDDGIPIIWACFSTDEFNKIATERTKLRQSEPWSSYKSLVTAAAEAPSLISQSDRGHVVIIMGYNKDTNEIAFSDSWGERYLERWITLPEAEQVSQERFYIIDL
ncbi:MAG: C39 family peptidase [Verrucomicrobiota bacterium]